MENYKFTNKAYGLEGMYGIDYESLPEGEKSLIEISWQGWTSQEIQMIIDKIEILVNDEEYDFQVEGSDFLISADKNEVYFYDWHTEQEEADFIWSKEKFITFMEAFKKFIKENK